MSNFIRHYEFMLDELRRQCPELFSSPCAFTSRYSCSHFAPVCIAPAIAGHQPLSADPTDDTHSASDTFGFVNSQSATCCATNEAFGHDED